MNDEQVTFDGIPIPLTLETLLTCYLYTYNIWKPVRARQRVAFRARILRMDAEKDDEIAVISDYFDNVFAQLEDCRKEIIEKDEEIRVLEKYIKDHDYKTILDYMEKYLEGDIE